ncbi:MAG TPA: hypothetical protein VIM51_10935 [Desulfosporosinus sp.]
MIWIRIILFILSMIIDGLSEDAAVAKASESFGVSASDIMNHL